MLRALSGKRHDVITGICLRRGKEMLRDMASTAVWFAPLTDREIQDYVDSGEPMDKAGAYGIQDWHRDLLSALTALTVTLSSSRSACYRRIGN